MKTNIRRSQRWRAGRARSAALLKKPAVAESAQKVGTRNVAGNLRQLTECAKPNGA